MNKRWNKDVKGKALDKEGLRSLNQSAAAGRKVLEKLIHLCDESIEIAIKKMLSEDTFKANWSAKQAALVGEIKSYKKTKELVNSLLTNTE